MYHCAADDERAAFLGRVCSWIRSTITGNTSTFGALVAALPGVDPVVVAASLRQLAGSDDGVAEAAALLLVEAEEAPATEIATQERPIPHPLDFYWAHTPQAIDSTVAELAASNDPGATIVYLGTPNIFRVATERLSGRSHVLLDRSAPRTEALGTGDGRVRRIDLLRNDLPNLQANAAVLDPPWYPDHMRGFLWAAAALLCNGADAWVAFPPAGTRCTVESETAQVLEAARAYGFELIETRRNGVRYLSSPFERASHRAARLGGIPHDWRSGELVHLRLARPLSTARPSPPEDDGPWLSFMIQEIPIWVRQRPPESSVIDEGLLRPLVPGDVLHSVSRRDPVRPQVDVWTSLNRVWASSHPPALESICRALAEGTSPTLAVEADLARPLASHEHQRVRTVADDLLEIVIREREEHGV